MEAFSGAHNGPEPRSDEDLQRDDFDDQPSLDWDFKLHEPTEGQSITDNMMYDRVDGTDLNGAADRSQHEPRDPASTELLDTLASILKNEKQRQTLCNMQGALAQVIIDYLDSILSKTVPKPWLRRHCLIALYKLCKTAQLYPRCYVLKNSIDPGSRMAFGGFSDVFKGKYREKELCLKMVRLNQSNMDAMLKRYAKEAILWGQLNHPNIVPFYGIYYLDGMRHQLCLLSPWMRHGDIVGYLKMNPSVPRAPFVYDVASGLGYLHELGLIHSDLKGANVLVNDQQEACLTDFGMSYIRTDKTLRQAMVTTTVHGFTQRWASPELLDDDARPTMASDIWALACVFYEILTGRLPFDHLANDLQIVRALIKGEVPAVQHLMLKREAVWQLIARCWAQEPTERSTCREILSDLYSAGISRSRDRNAQRDAAHESRSLRGAMWINREDYIDVDAVKQIFSDVRNSRPAALPNKSGSSSRPSRPPTDIKEHQDIGNLGDSMSNQQSYPSTNPTPSNRGDRSGGKVNRKNGKRDNDDQLVNLSLLGLGRQGANPRTSDSTNSTQLSIQGNPSYEISVEPPSPPTSPIREHDHQFLSPLHATVPIPPVEGPTQPDRPRGQSSIQSNSSYEISVEPPSPPTSPIREHDHQYLSPLHATVPIPPVKGPAQPDRVRGQSSIQDNSSYEISVEPPSPISPVREHDHQFIRPLHATVPIPPVKGPTQSDRVRGQSSQQSNSSYEISIEPPSPTSPVREHDHQFLSPLHATVPIPPVEAPTQPDHPRRAKSLVSLTPNPSGLPERPLTRRQSSSSISNRGWGSAIAGGGNDQNTPTRPGNPVVPSSETHHLPPGFVPQLFTPFKVDRRHRG